MSSSTLTSLVSPSPSFTGFSTTGSPTSTPNTYRPPDETTTGRERPPPNTEPGGGSNNPANSSSAALYLYTFLATLILLLGVSSAIVIRSLILRRRHRRMVEEAIRNGTWLAPTSANRRVDLSKKPKMYEAYVGEEDLEQGLIDGEGKLKQVVTVGNNHAEWSSVVPFSLVATESPSSTVMPSVTESIPDSPPTLLSRLRPNRYLRSRSTPMPAPPLVPTTVTTPSTSSIPDSVHVSVLIAMPSRTPLHRSAADEEPELPHLQIGVATVLVSGRDQEGKKSTETV